MLTFKLAWRNIRKHKGYALINVGGLALGLACALLFLSHIVFELSYDRHHDGAGRIYRVIQEYERDGRALRSPVLPGSLPLAAEFPEIERQARLFTYAWKEKALLTQGRDSLFEENFYLADPSLLDVFSFTALQGDPRAALEGTTGLVLSRSAARRYFGDRDPVGRTLTVKNLGQADMIVRAVIEDMPRNSHFRADVIGPIGAGEDLFWEGFPESNSFYTYLKLRGGASPRALEAKLAGFPARHLGERAAGGRLTLQPLTAIHFDRSVPDPMTAAGSAQTVILFGVLAAIILAVAVVNYVNLATARSIGRTHEIGVQKVFGAPRGALVRQFLGESLLHALIALLPAALLVQLLLPVFNALLGADLSLSFPGNGWVFLGAVLLPVAVGLASGLYPALVASRFEPIRVLRGRSQAGVRGSRLRSVLVVLQYAAAVVLMIGALVAAGQMRYVLERDLGFDQDSVVLIPVKDYETAQGYGLVKTAFQGDPAVRGVTASRGLPFRLGGTHNVWYEGLPAGEDVELAALSVDFDFIETYGLTLAAGRDFSPDHATDAAAAYLINESAARLFGWDEPLDKAIQFSNRGLRNAVYEPGRVIGVVRDFHFRSLHEGIRPLVLKVDSGDVTTIAVKLAAGRIREGLDGLAARWEGVFPGRPFDYSFLDQDVELMYREDRRTGRIFGVSTALSLLIAGLGLFGLVSFSAAQRTREIGIRKVLGATAGTIVGMLSRDFGRLVLLANLLAWPVAFILMSGWLRQFAYRMSLSPWIFVAAGGLSIGIALLGVAARAWLAAAADPVRSLRHE